MKYNPSDVNFWMLIQNAIWIVETWLFCVFQLIRANIKIMIKIITWTLTKYPANTYFIYPCVTDLHLSQYDDILSKLQDKTSHG